MAFVAAGMLGLGASAPVLAHAELVSSDPADKAVLAAPPTIITLTFSDGLDAAKSSFRLDRPGRHGRHRQARTRRRRRS